MFSSSRTLPGQSYSCEPTSTPSSQPVDRRADALRMLVDEVLDQQRDVVGAARAAAARDRDDVQPVEQIVPEPAFVDQLPQVAVGRRDHAHVDLLGPFGAERLDLALLQHAQQLGLQRRAHRADLVEEERAAVGQRELALAWCRSAPVNAPRTWPNSSDSSSVSGIAAQLTATNGIVALRAAVVDRARDQLLAGAGLAGDQHRAAGRGDQLDAARSPPAIGAAVADDAVVLEMRPDDRRREQSVAAISYELHTPLLLQTAMRDSLLLECGDDLLQP